MNVDVRPLRTAAESALAVNFAAARGSLPGVDKVSALRELAFGRFEAEGLPSRRVEEWKYTDLRALMRELKPLARPPDAAVDLPRPGRRVPGVPGQRALACSVSGGQGAFPADRSRPRV